VNKGIIKYIHKVVKVLGRRVVAIGAVQWCKEIQKGIEALPLLHSHQD